MKRKPNKQSKVVQVLIDVFIRKTQVDQRKELYGVDPLEKKSK